MPIRQIAPTYIATELCASTVEENCALLEKYNLQYITAKLYVP